MVAERVVNSTTQRDNTKYCADKGGDTIGEARWSTDGECRSQGQRYDLGGTATTKIGQTDYWVRALDKTRREATTLVGHFEEVLLERAMRA